MTGRKGFMVPIHHCRETNPMKYEQTPPKTE